GEIGPGTDERIGDVVVAALADEAPAIRFQALIAVQALALPSAEAALVRGTRDRDAEIRHIALRLLEERATAPEGEGASRREAAAAAVRLRLDDDVLRVRLAAAIFLARGGDSRGAPIIVEAVEAAGDGLDPEDEQAAIVLAGELALLEAVPALERRA